jgi:cytoskeletal protein CcmA (bactofilin family)
MWKRDEAVKPAPGAMPTTGSGTPPSGDPLRSNAGGEPQRGIPTSAGHIGKSVVIKGELNGSEDLTIEGQVDGKIELRENVLTIGPNGRIKAQVFAKSVVVLGEVTGNVTASDKVDIREDGSVDGDITAPRVAIAEGAHFRGSIDMQKATARAPESKSADAKPAEARPADAKPADARPAAAPAASATGVR